MVVFLIMRRAPRRTLVAVVVPVIVAALAWSAWVMAHQNAIDPELALGYGNYSAHLTQAGLTAVAVNVPDLSRPLDPRRPAPARLSERILI